MIKKNKAICIEDHITDIDYMGKLESIKFSKMKVYEYSVMKFPKMLYFPNNPIFEICKNDGSSDCIVYSLTHPDVEMSRVPYNETDFKKYFSTEILKFQRKEGLNKISKK